uniref:Cytochrome c oxidase subunit 3 n=1 Tax=Pelecotoma fennica TaxID=433262 RepID=A0A343A484_9CUCU|nr:cytochrome c oxidase subunit III [Pelecotoma fennica]AOY39362.1 cytochrome c oxidase subunit 3 [Pelecotoma fennica]
MNSHKNHPFHLVDLSPWPITSALSALVLMSGLISWFHLFNPNLLLTSMILMLLSTYQWWRDIIRESTLQGHHTFLVGIGLRWGMILFITSEIFFFLSFFWSFFHMSLSPTVDIGLCWPPKGIETFNPLQIPLLNTLILITSGLSVTWAHHNLMENNFKATMRSLIITVILGMYFTILQAYEYQEASFSISDSAYGATFYVATGFHGIHVIVGTIFLTICLTRMMNNHLSSYHHFGFEAAAWYWHFVDIVWLFLYISIYWWSS